VKHTPTWLEVLTLEELLSPTGHEAHRFRAIVVPPEVQARFDALSDDEKRRLRIECDVMMEALYAGCGITRSNA